MCFCASFLAAAQQNPAGYLSTDSVTCAASNQYQLHSFLHRWLMGKNYREAWEQGAKVPVFYFSRTGFAIKELGGGGQTKSLHLLDSQGREWSLRTVAKIINDSGLSPVLRNAPGRRLSQDILSAGFPYAAPLAGELAFAAGITAARVPVFFVANDTALGPYQSLFGGTLCTLEERDAGFADTQSSEDLYAALRRSAQAKVQQRVYLRARLLDLLMADWDRHPGNWRWGLKDSAGFAYWYAVPRDRDWAFSSGKGLLPWLVQKTGAMPYLLPFTKKPANFKKLSAKCSGMDHRLTNELTAADWEAAVRDLQASLSDEALQRALTVLPAVVYKTVSEPFFQTLQNRRDGLLQEAMTYYRFLAKEAAVDGSEEDETFVAEATATEVRVRVYASKNGRLLFDRRFLSSETYGVSLNGFGGNDVFLLRGEKANRVRLTVNGGEGQNRHRLEGRLRSKIKNSEADAALFDHFSRTEAFSN